MPALHEKRLREFHEGEVQLALRPPGIGEVGVDNENVHLVRQVKAGTAYAGGLSRRLVNDPHLHFIHPAAVHFDLREGGL